MPIYRRRHFACLTGPFPKLFQLAEITDRYEKLQAGLFVLVWVWAAIAPKYRYDWWLENVLVIIFVPLVVWLGRYFRFSRISYTLITAFLVLHVIGSHDTYSEVPFGYVLQEWLGAGRNMYERRVHFCFGFLLAYLVREMFVRVTRVKGFWSFISHWT